MDHTEFHLHQRRLRPQELLSQKENGETQILLMIKSVKISQCKHVIRARGSKQVVQRKKINIEYRRYLPKGEIWEMKIVIMIVSEKGKYGTFLLTRQTT